jgi:hypothetical protein
MHGNSLAYTVTVIAIIIGVLGRHVIHALQVDPKIQYQFHRCMSFVWLANIIGVLFVPSLHPNPADLFIIEASLYANFATEFGAMSAALAAIHGDSSDDRLAKNDQQLAANDARLIAEVHAMFDPATQPISR